MPAPRMLSLITVLMGTIALSACQGGGSGPDNSGGASGSGSADPTAQDDSATTDPGIAVSIAVLDNDVAGAPPLELSDFDPSGTNGAVVRDDRGSAADRSDDRLVYTPDGGFTGVDSFDYTVTNANGRSDTATVTVTVSETAQALDDRFFVDRDSSDNSLDVLANDDNGMVVVELDTNPSEVGSQFRIGDNGQSVIYTPPAGFVGTDRVRYTAERQSGGQTQRDVAEVIIEVGEPAQPTNACRTDIEQRLDAGQGYCYDATFTTAAGVLIDFTVFVPHPDQLRANAAANF